MTPTQMTCLGVTLQRQPNGQYKGQFRDHPIKVWNTQGPLVRDGYADPWRAEIRLRGTHTVTVRVEAPTRIGAARKLTNRIYELKAQIAAVQANLRG